MAAYFDCLAEVPDEVSDEEEFRAAATIALRKAGASDKDLTLMEVERFFVPERFTDVFTAHVLVTNPKPKE